MLLLCHFFMFLSVISIFTARRYFISCTGSVSSLWFTILALSIPSWRTKTACKTDGKLCLWLPCVHSLRTFVKTWNVDVCSGMKGNLSTSQMCFQVGDVKIVESNRQSAASWMPSINNNEGGKWELLRRVCFLWNEGLGKKRTIQNNTVWFSAALCKLFSIKPIFKDLNTS